MATAQNYAPMMIRDYSEEYVYPFYEAATQTFKAGAPVIISSGKVQLVVAAGNNLGANDDIAGIALEDATGTAGTAGNEDKRIRVYVISRPTILTLPIYHATAASAVSAIASIGVAYELRYDATQGLCIDIGSTTNVKGKIIGFPNCASMPIGTQYALADFMINSTECQFGTT